MPYKDPEKQRAYLNTYYEKNWDKFKQYRVDNKEKLRTSQRAYWEKNRDKKLSYHREYDKKRRECDINFRLSGNLRDRICNVFRGKSKSKSTLELLGCSLDELKEWIESQFEEGMSWDNYGSWHIDHVYPCALFDLQHPYEQRIAFHWFNLQPLWAKDNLQKSAKINIL